MYLECPYVYRATDGGYNLIEDGSCLTEAGTNSISGDPNLGDLKDNGGPTETHALLADSPAIDKGNNAFAVDPDGNTLQFDQRGQTRPSDFSAIPNVPEVGGDGSDIGAFEVQAPPATPVAVDIKPATCPNPLSTSDTGTYPVSIVGTNSFDVSKIDPATLKLEGVSAQTGRQVTIKDVATPYSGTITNPPLANQCTTAGPDAQKDLNLKFVAKDVLNALAPVTTVTNKEVRVLKLSGNLKSAYGGTPIQGQDVVVINKKK